MFSLCSICTGHTPTAGNNLLFLRAELWTWQPTSLLVHKPTDFSVIFPRKCVKTNSCNHIESWRFEVLKGIIFEPPKQLLQTAVIAETLNIGRWHLIEMFTLFPKVKSFSVDHQDHHGKVKWGKAHHFFSFNRKVNCDVKIFLNTKRLFNKSK